MIKQHNKHKQAKLEIEVEVRSSHIIDHSYSIASDVYTLLSLLLFLFL